MRTKSREKEIIKIYFHDPLHETIFAKQMAYLLHNGWKLVARTHNSATFKKDTPSPDHLTETGSGPRPKPPSLQHKRVPDMA